MSHYEFRLRRIHKGIVTCDATGWSFVSQSNRDTGVSDFTAFDGRGFNRNRPLIMPMSLEFDGVHAQTDTTDSLFTEGYVYSHQNVFIHDGLTLYRYEPMFRPDKAMPAIDATIQKKWEDRRDTSPGVQNRYPGENCVLYCAFFIHAFLEQYVHTPTTRQAYENTMKQIRTWCTSGEYPDLLLTFTRNVLYDKANYFHNNRVVGSLSLNICSGRQ